MVAAGAQAEPWMGAPLPNGAVGFGKLRLHSSWTGGAPPAAPSPSLVLEVVSGDGAARVIKASLSGAAGEGGWRFRWDDTYDGAWDTGFDEAGERTIIFPAVGTWVVRTTGVAGNGVRVDGALAVQITSTSAIEPTRALQTWGWRSPRCGPSRHRRHSMLGGKPTTTMGGGAGSCSATGASGRPPAWIVGVLCILLIMRRRADDPRGSF